MATTKREKLFTEFPPVSTEQWEEVIKADLKGADYERKLVWKTPEGFNVRPYYRAENLAGLKFLGSEAGVFPYVRGTRAHNRWKIHQTVIVNCPKEANAVALKILNAGVDSIEFQIVPETFSAEDLNTLLKDIHIPAVEITFSGSKTAHVAELVIAKIEKEQLPAEEVHINFCIDPLVKKLTSKGSFCSENGAKCFEKIADLIRKTKAYKGIRVITVSGEIFSNAGSTIVEALAFSLAAGHDYLVRLMDMGFTIEEAAKKIRFSQAITSNYFMEIAKLRAGRMLWANIVKAYNPAKNCPCKMFTHAVTSTWNQTAYDPYVNMLRGTTEAMSASIAGVHSLEVTPFNKAYEDPNEFSMRIARNVELLLKHESHFDQVVDPAGGSYYIENLTDSIANEAWKLFREIEEKGGYTAAYESGFIVERVKASAAAKDKNIATRREILLGANQYPNFTEVAGKELTEAARGMREAMDEAKATYDDTVTSTMAAAGVADTYIGKLEEMEAAGLNTDEQHRQYHNTLALLCQVVPELADYIDLETDTINGGTEALRANTEAWKQNAMQQAYQDQLTELYSQYSAVLIEAEENSIGLTKAQYSLEAAQQKLSDTYAQMDALWADAQKQADAYYDQYGYYTDATAFLSQEYYDLQNSIYDTNNEIWAAEKSIKNYNKAMEDDADAVSDAEAEIALAEEAVKNLTASMNEGTGASEEAAAQVSEFQAAISGVQEKINALVESYNEAYSAAYESISGQYQLWDEAAKVVATSAGSINSALESQITYWQDYNANLQSLTDRSADIEGLSDMIASFADGSSDSVNAIAGMAGATDEQLATMVANWKTLQQEQQNAAGSADLKTDFTATMDELQTALAEDIEAMDLGDEAKASAQATIQGFIDGAVGMLPQVTAAYNRVAAAARAALSASGTGTAGSIPGYAVGTQSAAPGFALVGENGPELVYFNGGEQVMTAEETAAMRESMEIQAITFAPQLLEAMHAIQGDGALSASLPGQSSELPPIIIENTFHVEGNATPETIAALADYGDSLKEVVREAIAEIEEDVSRTMYR